MNYTLATYLVNLKQVQRLYNEAIRDNDDTMAAKWAVERARILACINDRKNYNGKV